MSGTDPGVSAIREDIFISGTKFRDRAGATTLLPAVNRAVSRSHHGAAPSAECRCGANPCRRSPFCRVRGVADNIEGGLQ